MGFYSEWTPLSILLIMSVNSKKNAFQHKTIFNTRLINLRTTNDEII